VPTIVKVNVLQVHRLCTAILERQCSVVPVVAPSFKRLVLLRTARLAASPARPALTAVAACTIAVSVY
jgi:hypothetical protein